MAGPDRNEHDPKSVRRWSRGEVQAFGIGAAVLFSWGGAFALFGFAGLITVALLMVLVAFTALIMISRG